MKTVSDALDAAIKQRVWKPALSVKIDDRRNAGVSPLVWSEWYDGAETNVAHTAMATSGSYVCEVRVNSNTNEIYHRRTLITADPGDSAWSKMSGSVRDDAQVAMCADGDDVWFFWVDTDKKTIKYRKSTNAGVSYAATATAVTLAAGHKCNSLAAVCPGSSLHDVVLLMLDSPTEDDITQDKALMWAYHTTGGGWAAAADWGRASGKVGRGIGACAHDSDSSHTEITFVVATKFEVLTSGNNLQAYHLNIDDAHAPTFTLAATPYQSSTDSVGPNWPSMVAEGTYDRARIVYQLYDGALPSAKRWQAYHLYIHELLSGDELVIGPVSPFHSTNHAFTLGLCRVGDVIVGGANNSLWKSDVWDGSDPWLVDVTADVIAFEHHVYDNALIEDIGVYPGYCWLFLNNQDGRYDDMGQPGATHEAIKRGSQIIIKAGYQTPTGDEIEQLPPMWIDRIIQVCNPRSSASQDIPHVSIPGAPLLGGRYVVLKGYDCWMTALKRGPNYTYNGSSAPRSCLSWAFAQMGFAYSDDGTARLGLGGGGYPAVTWITQGGTPWYLMIRDILRYCHCRVKFSPGADEGTWPTANAYAFADRDVDPADLEIGGEGEVMILAGLYTELERFGGYGLDWQIPPYSPNTSLMVGASTGAVLEADGASEIEIDYDAAELAGYWQPRQVVDYQVTDATYISAADRVGFAATDVEPLFGGQVLIPLHPCLEIWDRIHITDRWATQSVQKRFVVGIDSYYDTKGKRARFDQVVHLMRHVR